MTCGSCKVPTNQRDNAVICYGCIWGERDVDCDVTHCTVSGRPVAEHIRGGSCPKGKHPSAGMVRGAVTYTYGVPWLPRLMAWARHKSHPDPRTFSGCGCISIAKDLWTRLAGTNKLGA